MGAAAAGRSHGRAGSAAALDGGGSGGAIAAATMVAVAETEGVCARTAAVVVGWWWLLALRLSPDCDVGFEDSQGLAPVMVAAATAAVDLAFDEEEPSEVPPLPMDRMLAAELEPQLRTSPRAYTSYVPPNPPRETFSRRANVSLTAGRAS